MATLCSSSPVIALTGELVGRVILCANYVFLPLFTLSVYLGFKHPLILLLQFDVGWHILLPWLTVVYPVAQIKSTNLTLLQTLKWLNTVFVLLLCRMPCGPRQHLTVQKKNFFFGLVIYLTTLDFILMLNYIGLNFILRIQAVFIFGDLNTCWIQV